MSYELNTNIQSQTVYLDSTNCTQRSPYFNYDFKTAIQCPMGCRLLVSVQSVTIPQLVNNITVHNNHFSIRYITTNYTIIIPVGIYSAWSLRDYLNYEFTNVRLIPVSIVYNESQYKYEFYSTGQITIINTENHPTTIGGVIGVNKDNNNQYIYPVEYGEIPAFNIRMTGSVNFVPTPYIYIKVNNLSLSNINSRGEINDTLLRIPLNCEYGQLIQYRPTELNRFLINKNDINNFQIKLEDIHNNPLSIPNNVEIQLILKIDFINTPSEVSYHEGTITHYFKNLPKIIDDKNLDEEEES